MFNVFLGLASLTIDLFAKHVVLGPELVGMIVLPAPANDRNENLKLWQNVCSDQAMKRYFISILLYSLRAGTAQ